MVLLLGFWTCPIFFRGEALIEEVPWMMHVNPMAGIIHNARPMLLTDAEPDFFILFYDLLICLIFFIIGHLAVKKTSLLALEKL